MVLAFITYAGIALAPLVILIGARRLPGDLARLRVLLIRIHLWRKPVEPLGPPLEQLAADLRRLYQGAHFPQKGVRMPKQRGVLMAYDQRLVETAKALQVPTTLSELPLDCLDREAERLRLEWALTEAGLVWQVRNGDTGVDPAA